MTIAKSHPAGPCSAEQVEAFETETGQKLPDEYRNWLLACNGGRPEPKRMEFIENGIPTGSDVHWLSGIGGPGWVSLEDVCETLRSRVPAACIPVGRDSGGNQYLLDTVSGRVYFWDHEEESRTTAAMLLCADSFDAFLLKLKARED